MHAYKLYISQGANFTHLLCDVYLTRHNTWLDNVTGNSLEHLAKTSNYGLVYSTGTECTSSKKAAKVQSWESNVQLTDI